MYNCKDCNLSLGPDSGFGMVMVHDHIWGKISDEWHDLICADCMENRMGRKITEDDFKSEGIPCNEEWLVTKTGKVSKYMQKYLDNQK